MHDARAVVLDMGVAEQDGSFFCFCEGVITYLVPVEWVFWLQKVIS